MNDRAVDTTCVHVIITGRVQGVWFRGWTAQQAASLDLRGWVRNRANGTVEAVFAGSTEAVKDMLERCENGPPLARVDGMDVSDVDDEGFNGFEKRPTV